MRGICYRSTTQHNNYHRAINLGQSVSVTSDRWYMEASAVIQNNGWK